MKSLRRKNIHMGDIVASCELLLSLVNLNTTCYVGWRCFAIFFLTRLFFPRSIMQLNVVISQPSPCPARDPCGPAANVGKSDREAKQILSGIERDWKTKIQPFYQVRIRLFVNSAALALSQNLTSIQRRPKCRFAPWSCLSNVSHEL